MEWKTPPLNKVYEALGAIGDMRIELDGNTAKVYSSSRAKYYEVEYDAKNNSITANDNGSFWVGYLGYPVIAYLLAEGIVTYDKNLAKYLSDFAWKEINQKFKNDFEKTDDYIDEQIVRKYKIDLDLFHAKLQKILADVMALKLKKLGKTKRPPQGY